MFSYCVDREWRSTRFPSPVLNCASSIEVMVTCPSPSWIESVTEREFLSFEGGWRQAPVVPRRLLGGEEFQGLIVMNMVG